VNLEISQVIGGSNMLVSAFLPEGTFFGWLIRYESVARADTTKHRP
jgi:hypothetical protein